MEERYSTLRKKMLLSEQNIIEAEKNHFQEISVLNENIMELKKSLKEALEKVSLLSDEIDNFAPRTDMITLQRYLEYWQPMDYVTRKEVNDFLRRKFGVAKNSKDKEPEKTTKESNPENSKTEKNKEEESSKPKVPSIEDAYPDTD